MSVERARLVERLRQYYESQRLLVSDFACRYGETCRQAADCQLSQGAEAHVGSRYGDDLRVVVVSLDAAGSAEAMDSRRANIEGSPPRNPHMKGTARLLQAIYGPGRADSSDQDLFELYAMTNAAKCSRKAGSERVPSALYRNCRAFAKPELARLRPQLIATQGNEAYEALESPKGLSEAHESLLREWMRQFPEPARDWLASLANEYLMTVSVGDRDVPLVKTVHPSARGGQWQRFVRIGLRPVAHMAKHLADRVPP